MKGKLISGIVAIVILGGVAYGGYTYMNKPLDKGNTQSVNSGVAGSSAANTNSENSSNIASDNTSNTSSLNNSNSNSTQNIDTNNSSNSSNSETTNNSNSNSQSQSANNSVNNNMKNQNTDQNTENKVSNVGNKNSNSSVASMNNSQASSNQNKDTTKVSENNTSSNASDLQPNNNEEVSKYFGTWVVGKQVGDTIGTDEKMKSYKGDKIVLTKDLFSFQNTIINNPIYYIKQVDFGGYFGESQYDNYGNVKVDSQGDLAMLMVRSKSNPYTKSGFSEAFPQLGIILSGNQLITHGGGIGGTSINDCNKVN